MKITKRFLQSKGACNGQVQKFAKLFPKGTAITEDAVRKAMAADLSVSWLINALAPAVHLSASEEFRVTPEFRAYAKLENKIDSKTNRSDTRHWVTRDRLRGRHRRDIIKIERSRDLSLNQMERAKKALKAHYDRLHNESYRAERKERREIRKQFAAERRKLLKARTLRHRSILFRALQNAAAQYAERLQAAEA